MRTIILYDKRGVPFLRERVTNKQITRHRPRIHAVIGVAVYALLMAALVWAFLEAIG